MDIYTLGISLYVVFLASSFVRSESDCGGFIEMDTDLPDTLSGQLTSPNYPNNYDKWFRCIWLLQAPKNFNIELIIQGIDGEPNYNTGVCDDLLQVRNGTSEATILFTGCQGESATIVSESRWLWVYFKSDDDAITGKGFEATWSVLKAEVKNINDEDPWDACIFLRDTCPNKECVPESYWCDGQLDCGCIGPGCDESRCGTFEMSLSVRVGLGVGVGVFVFLVIFLGIGFLEIFLKKRSEEDYKKKLADQKKRDRKKKSDKEVAEITKMVEKAESIRLDLPSRKASTASISTIYSFNTTTA